VSLREQLEARWRLAGEKAPEFRRAYEALMRDLAASALIDSALKAGTVMPEFELPSVEGRFVSSAELVARGPLVVSFFRGGWCPYCTLELQALQQALPEIEAHGASLIAVTPDTGAALAAAKRANGLDYQVLSDLDNGVGLAFGIVFRVPETIRTLYRGLGLDLGARHGNRTGEWLLPLPATYIVDRQGVIRHAELDADFTHRMEPADIIRVLQELDRG
jgi:peroxiredoxin